MDEAKRVLREAFASALSANNNTADGTERPSVVINGPVTVNVFGAFGEVPIVDVEPSGLMRRRQVLAELPPVNFEHSIVRSLHRSRS